MVHPSRIFREHTDADEMAAELEETGADMCRSCLAGHRFGLLCMCACHHFMRNADGDLVKYPFDAGTDNIPGS